MIQWRLTFKRWCFLDAFLQVNDRCCRNLVHFPRWNIDNVCSEEFLKCEKI